MFSLIKDFNIILAADAYKFDHCNQLNPETRKSYVVCVPRKPSKYATRIVAMGQSTVSFILSKVRVTMEMIDEAELEINQQGYEFNREGWEIIVKEHGGRLPLQIWGVEEGRVITPQTPVIGIINTDDRLAWLPAYVETWTQEMIWKMSTVASICRVMRITIESYMKFTGSDMSMLDYKVHNFGDRGADSPHESPIMAGIAHAALFNGSDGSRVNGFIKTVYNTDLVATTSVVATEHSVMCSHSDAVTKDDYFAAVMCVNRLEKVVIRSKAGIGIPVMSSVIDTYNSRRFVRSYMGTMLKDRIVNSGGTMVMRPDSGKITVEPVLVAFDLKDTFGYTQNAAGYDVLPGCVRVIQGDGLNVRTFRGPLQAYVDANLSIDNLTLGSGSGITHDGARDDFSFSMKAVASYDGVRWTRLLKSPNTDVMKKSLSGLVRCRENADGELEVYDCLVSGDLYTFTSSTPGWRMWYEDGYMTHRQPWTSVRDNARIEAYPDEQVVVTRGEMDQEVIDALAAVAVEYPLNKAA